MLTRSIEKDFYMAQALIEGETVLVTSDKVKKPVAVRFTFYNTAEPNLFNKEGLPAASFRTDNWHIDSVPVKPTFPN